MSKRQQVTNFILKHLKTMDPSGLNHDRYKAFFSDMSDAEFDKYMKQLKAGEVKLCLYAPNMKNPLKVEHMYKVAKELNVKLFQRITFKDEITGMTYTTPNEYLVVTLPVRRARQFLMHKMSVFESDKKLDAMTGQVTKPDKSSSISFIEAQLLASRGLYKTLVECLKVRSDDVNAFSSFKRQLEENGSGQLNSLDPNTVPRSAATLHTVLTCMYYGNNIVEGL